MSMEEKYNGFWINITRDDSAKIVFEKYLSDIDKLWVIYERSDGNYQPYCFIKKEDYQWSLPIWTPENTKVIMPSMELAKEYLENYF